MFKYACLIVLVMPHVQYVDSSDNFIEIEELDQVWDEKGALTEFFHSSILGENESNDKKLAAIDKSPQLITVEDFLSLTEHKYPLPRIDLAGINEAAEDLQSEDVPEEEDGTYQHNSNDPTSVILKLDDSTEAVSISGSLESISSPTKV